MSDDDLRDAVRRRYREAARRIAPEHAGEPGGDDEGFGGRACCSVDWRSRGDAARLAPEAGRADDPVTRGLYGAEELEKLPEGMESGSLGCGNPTALLELREGETVLDLGSGSGLDVLLSARRVGPSGKAIGVDVTPGMVERARSHAREAGIDNVEFLQGEMEDLPLADASVDVVISNCVINLSTEKERVLGELSRVLRPGGRLGISDVVVRGRMPEDLRRSMELWVGCVSGALEESSYRELLREAGFESVEIEPTRVYDPEDAREFFRGAGLDPDRAAEALEGKFMAAFVRGTRPRDGDGGTFGGRACCGAGWSPSPDTT